MGIKTKEKKEIHILITILLCLIITYIIFVILFKGKTSFAVSKDIEPIESEVRNVEIANNSLELEKILVKNKTNLRKEEIIKQEIDLEYTTKYMENNNIPKGVVQVIQEGIDGKQEIYIKKIYTGENLIEEKQLESKITKAAVNKIVEIGTSNYINTYKVKQGDKLYVSTSLLAIRLEPNEESTKVISLNKNESVTFLKKQGEWYQVKYKTYTGWAKSECFTYINNNIDKNTEQKAEVDNKKYSKSQLVNKLDFNMKLNEPSGLTLEQFNKIFKNDSKDKNKVFEDNAKYFYYAEKQYNINGIFLASVAIHESNWGSSKISKDKKNLFGYGAYDSNPYSSSYKFTDYSESIDLLARVFTKYYLNPKGTKIYGGNIAEGTYYNGPTLKGVNTKYATDKNWANGVYSWMKYLYNKL